MRKGMKKSVAVLLTLIMVLASMNTLWAVATSVFTVPDGWFLISDKKTNIAPGIVENKVIVNNATGNNQVMGYAVSVDMSAGSPTAFMGGYANYDGSTWVMQTVRDQAAKAETARHVNIVAAVNADIYNMSTGEPSGALVLNGRVYKSGLGRPYFAVLKDGSVVIGSSMTQEVLDNTQEAIGGFYTLVENGARVGNGKSDDTTKAPKTAIGIKADGTVIVYVADGRNYPISCGLSNYELASIMLGFGCVDVLNLDGGGSTTYAAQYEGSDTLQVANNPSDGVERKVSSSLFIVSTALPTGVFDHASLEPNNDIYTPGSSVEFSAKGVDSAGASADLPADGQFVLADDSKSLGSITADGKFTSNGSCGTATVNYVSGGSVYGTTSVEIQNPDEIYFSDSEVNLGFGEESDLGLNAKYKGRDVIYKVGDFVWSLKNDPIELGGKFEYNSRKVIYNADDSTLHYYTTQKSGSNTIIILGDALTEAEKTDFFNTIMGSFDGNIFTSTEGNTINGTITCKYANDESISTSLRAIIGRLPVVVQDFERTDIEFGRVVFNANGGVATWESENSATANMLTGHYQNGNGTSRGGNESAAIVDVDSGEPVRFGNQSLKLNYDFTNINGTEGACVGFTEAGTIIEGNPTGIGMWVYAPEGTPNFWLRIRLLDGSNNILNLDYTAQKEGINWSGWKYVECSLGQKQGPFRLLAGETIRLMHLYSALDGMGDWLAGTVSPAGPDENSVALDRSTCKGSIYIDNLQFVYGANVDDIDNPVIDTITANQTEITNGCTVTDSTIDFQATFHDVENKYTSGIDYDVVRMYVDGVNRSYDENCVLTPGDNRIDLYGLKLADGEHTVTVLLRDKFGNETTETCTFNVDTSGESGLTYMNVASDEAPVLGQNFSLYLKSSDIDAIDEINTTITAGSAYADFTVEFTQGFTGTYSHNTDKNEIALTAERNTDDIPDGIDYAAKITYKIPTDLASGAQFTYSVPTGVFTLTGSDDATLANSFASSTRRLNIVAAYTVTADPMVVGMGGNVYVTDSEGNPASGVNVYYAADNALLGTTSKSGSFYTEALTSAVAEYSIYAKSDEGISFIFSSQSVASQGNSDGTPTQTMINASTDSDSSKNITWLSSPVASGSDPVVQYAEKSAYEAQGEDAFVTAEGTSEIRQLMGSGAVATNHAVRVNTVVVRDLSPATTYVYRVGDGTIFGETSTFATSYDGISTNFFVIGDTQAEDVTNIRNIINTISNSDINYTFGVQTGDFVEKSTIYSDWNNILNVFAQDYMSTVDMIHVVGNHEQVGDDMNNLFAASLFNLKNSTHYSVEYGNVYVAVINYTNNRAQLESELEWLVNDASASNCQWKIVVSHQPTYGTNVTASDCDHFRELMPGACEAAGIDAVFSGHDHAYARTFPVANGKVDEENGVVYYICGSTGEKSYTATNNPEYNFEVVDQDYTAIYLSVEATDEYFRVTTCESNGAPIDNYTILSDEDCAENGHEFTYSDGYLSCSKCGHSELLGTYTGFATDAKTGKVMYFIGGVAQTGWFSYLNDCYYFDENGLAATGTVTINGIEYTFNDDGTQSGGTFVTDENGVTRCYRGGTYLKGWHEINGYTYYFHTANGSMATGEDTVTVRTGQKLNCVFSSDGKLLRGAFYETDEGTKYYWGGDLVSGWTVIDGEKYYFDPVTNLMAVDSVEIDGNVYAFSMEGVYRHDGAHEWKEGAVVGTSNCELYTVRMYKCSICGSIKMVIEEPKEHVDEDGNGICDDCGQIIVVSNAFYKVVKKIISIWIEILRKIYEIFKG